MKKRKSVLPYFQRLNARWHTGRGAASRRLKERSGKESKLLPAAGTQQIHAVSRRVQMAGFAEAARVLTTSGAAGSLPAASASRGASAYRITPCSPITNVGWKFLTSASS